MRSKLDDPIQQTAARYDLGNRPVSAGAEGQDLRVLDVRKSFQSPAGETVNVLHGIDFQVAPGQIVAVTGPSGSGKSTLLHLLGGLENADHGSIQLGSFDISAGESSELVSFRRRNVGFVFQFHHLLGDLTALENVALPLLIGRKSRKEAVQRAFAALEELDLSGKGSLPVGHLSGGEQQKVAIARALISRPRLVLADEPSGNLDASSGDEIAALLRNYCRRQEAIVIVATHSERMGRFCDRVIRIQNGRIETQRDEASERSGSL